MLQPQLLMSIPAANYCSSSSAAAEENSSPSPLLSSLPPSSPSIHILWSESADLTPTPLMKDDYPAAKGEEEEEGEEGIREMVKKEA